MARISFEVFSDEPREDWVEVPFSLSDPSAGVARLKLREIPATEWGRLQARRASRRLALAELGQAMVQRRAKLAETLSPAEASVRQIDVGDEYAGAAVRAQEEITAIHREVVSAAVVDHDPDGFLVEVPRGAPRARVLPVLEGLGLAPEEIDWALAEGVTTVRFNRSAARLYERIAEGFLELVVAAVARFQECVVRTAAELWEEAKPLPPREVLLARRAELERELREVDARLEKLPPEEGGEPPLGETGERD